MRGLLPNSAFREPPEAVASQGMAAVRDYFHEVFKERHISERRDLKAVIIGESGAGKTRYEVHDHSGVFIRAVLHVTLAIVDG